MISRVLFVLALLMVATSGAADWPQWRGPERTGHVPAGEPVPEKLPAEPRIVWRVPIGDGFASPVVSGGRVFHLDNQDGQEVAHGVEAATGKEIWRATIFSSHKDGFGIGPRCTPVADGSRVFVQSAKGEFQCLGAADGKVIWRKNFVDDFGAIYIGEKGKAAGASRHGANGSPVIDGENVIAQVGSANGASLVAFNKATGDVVWKSENDQTAYAAPIVATLSGVRQLISFTAEALIGLDASNGKLLWRAPLKTALGRHVTTPNVWHDLVVVASHQIGLVAVRVAKDGASEAWLNKAMTINFSSPVVVGDHLYGLGPAKNLVCIDLATGQLAWEKPGLTPTSPDRAEAAFLVLGRNLLVLTDSGELLLCAADPAGYRELGRTQVCGNTWCNPAYADGRLYLRDARELLCVDLLK
ncbi:MAG: outer membrane protein assembly factor BamB [Chthoniobacter sp.]|jgi:outer membrane protein assembly factor BamB|nr:outer membrane protein assembly factor BamB [Chthoniobacter sp.]